MKSKCCNAEIRVEGDVTKYYSCLGCGKACDVVSPTTNQVSENKKLVSSAKNAPVQVTLPEGLEDLLNQIYWQGCTDEEYINGVIKLLQSQDTKLREKVLGEVVTKIRKYMDKHEKADSSFSTDNLIGHLMKEIL